MVTPLDHLHGALGLLLEVRDIVTPEYSAPTDLSDHKERRNLAELLKQVDDCVCAAATHLAEAKGTV